MKKGVRGYMIAFICFGISTVMNGIIQEWLLAAVFGVVTVIFFFLYRMMKKAFEEDEEEGE